MELLNASNFDIFKIAALLAAFFVNRQSAVVLFGMLIGELLFYLVGSWFWFCILAGWLYSLNATVFIKIDSGIRYALILTACLYWLAAVDDFLFPTIETMYYNSLGYIVGAVDMYVLLVLLNGGRRRDRVTCSRRVGFLYRGAL
jgi:hypothetical protein